MNARIEKRLSKKIFELLPNIYKNIWVDDGPTDKSYKERNKVSNCLCIGDECYWGEGQDVRTIWEDFKLNYPFIGGFPIHVKDEFNYGWPDTSGFKETTINLIRLAKSQSKTKKQ